MAPSRSALTAPPCNHGPWFNTAFSVLEDAPELRPALDPIVLSHDILSKLIANVTPEGPLGFVDDSRLIFKLSNADALASPTGISLFGIELGGCGTGRSPARSRYDFALPASQKLLTRSSQLIQRAI